MMDMHTVSDAVDTITAHVLNVYANTSFILFTFCVTLVLLYRLMKHPFKAYILAQLLPGTNLQELGKWAVVTGGTDGIGE